MIDKKAQIHYIHTVPQQHTGGKMDTSTNVSFRAVDDRCAVDLASLNIPLLHEKTLDILIRIGFQVIEVDMLKLARDCIGKSTYCRGSRSTQAPAVVDCSGFMKWLYAQCGIWLPRRSIQQRAFGTTVSPGEIAVADLIFTSGRIDYWDIDPSDGIGHVGMATGDGTVIHAANKSVGVVETPIELFTTFNTFRGVRRILPLRQSIITLVTPPHREVETSDDIRWIVLQNLSR